MQEQEEWKPKLRHRTKMLEVLWDTQYEYHDSTHEHWDKQTEILCIPISIFWSCQNSVLIQSFASLHSGIRDRVLFKLRQSWLY